MRPDTLQILFEKSYILTSFFSSLQFSSLNGLGSVRSLKKIVINDAYNLKHLDDLKGLTSLEYLDFYHCDSLKNLDGLKELTNLKELDLRHTEITHSQIHELKKSLPGLRVFYTDSSSVWPL